MNIYLSIKYYLWNLSVFDRGAVIVSGSVRELESHPAGTTTRIVHATFAQSFRSVVGVQSLEMRNKWRVTASVRFQNITTPSRGGQGQPGRQFNWIF